MASDGIDWCQLDTALLTDDEKVFELMGGGCDGVAFADFGRFVALLLKIYRNGPGLEVSPMMSRRIAHDLGMERGEFEEFVGRCVEAELFDRGLWERLRVLTSHGIQQRWMAAKKRRPSDGLYAKFQEWSLLDEEDGETARLASPRSGSQSLASSRSDSQRLASSRNDSQNPALDKTRQDKKREDEREVVLSGEEGTDVENPAPAVEKPPTERLPSVEIGDALCTTAGACLSHEVAEDVQFVDDADGLHRTPLGALAQIYPARTGRGDLGQFVGLVSDLCPADCRGDPERERQCFALLEKALRGYDPERGSPWGKTRVVLTQDRGW